VLLTDIEADSQIEYAHLLVVFEQGQQDPVGFISSEAKGNPTELLKELGLEDIEVEQDDGPSHFLCAFTPTGHHNFNASNDWADLSKFEHAALELISRLKLIADQNAVDNAGME
jgi:hypothetical protein